MKRKKNKREKLKNLRKKHNLTQQQMAQRLGRSRSSYIAIENGIRDAHPCFWEKLQSEFNIPDSEMYSLQKGGKLNEK